MKQNSIEIVEWLKKYLDYTIRESQEIKNTDRELLEGSSDKWIERCIEAINFLDSLPDIEHRLARGGYILDRNGNICCEGDRVKTCDAFGHMIYEGTLVWDSEQEFHFLIQIDGAGKFIALKNYMEKM